MNMRERSTQEKSFTQRRRTPYSSSTLLDTIYRSIDESKSNIDEDQPMGTYRDALFLKQSNVRHNKHAGRVKEVGKERMNLRRAVMLEDWLENQSSRASSRFNSTSSSSGSSYGGVFSSSENESSCKRKPSIKPQRPFKNSKFETSEKKEQHQQKREQEGGFAKTKLRALKIYGELNRKVKQPISPGSRLASFINSIFNSGTMRKAKMCYVGAAEDVSFEQKSKSPCFSAPVSSFSRSCMRKAPSSARGKSSNDVKRSVRFYPVSVIIGEDSHTPNHCVHHNDPSVMPLPTIKKYKKTKELNNYATEKGHSMEAVAVAHDYLRDYRNQSTSKSVFRSVYDSIKDGDDEEGDESYSSSDLFELDHVIGTARYHEELPVFGTTSLGNNNAIANGLILQSSV